MFLLYLSNFTMMCNIFCTILYFCVFNAFIYRILTNAKPHVILTTHGVCKTDRFAERRTQCKRLCFLPSGPLPVSVVIPPGFFGGGKKHVAAHGDPFVGFCRINCDHGKMRD